MLFATDFLKKKPSSLVEPVFRDEETRRAEERARLAESPLGLATETIKGLPEAGGRIVSGLFDFGARTVQEAPEVKEEFQKGFRSGILQTGAALEIVGSRVAKKLGASQLSEKLEKLSQQDEELSQVGVNIEDPQKFSQAIQDPKFVARGIAQNLPNLLFAVGVATPAIAVGAPALAIGGLAFGAATTLEGGFAFNEAKEHGLSDEEAEKVGLIVGFANGLLETLPITRLFRRSPIGNRARGAVVKEITERVIEQSTLESGTESIQEIVSNAVGASFGEDRELFAGVPEAGFFGGIIGGGAGVAVEVGPRIRPGLTIEEVGPEETPGIPPELEPLAQEARKFKSAEEFAEVLSFERKVDFILPTSKIKVERTDIFRNIVEENKRRISAGEILEPISVVDPQKGIYSVIDGQHRLQAYKELGIKNIPVRFRGDGAIENLPFTQELTDFYNQAIRGTKEIKVPTTIEEFNVLSPEQQDRVFSDLSEELKKEIIGFDISEEEVGANQAEILANRILKGEIKIRVPVDIKTDVRETLGPAIYARIFRRDTTLPTLDEISSDNDLTSNELLEALSIVSDKRKRLVKEISTERRRQLQLLEIEGAVPARGRRARLGAFRGLRKGRVAGEAARTRAELRELRQTVKEALLRKRFTIGQRLRAEVRAEKRGVLRGIRIGRKEARAEILTRFRENRGNIEERRKQLTDYVKEHLATKDRGRANVIIRDAKTDEDLVKAFARIDNWADQVEKKTVRDNIIKIQRKALDSPNVAIDFKTRIQDAISAFELKGHTTETIQKLQETKKFIEREVALGEEVEMPMRVMRALEILNRQPFDEIPLSTLEKVEQDLTFLEQLGRTKWRSRQHIYQLERDAIKEELIAGTTSINRIEKFKPFPGERLTRSQKVKNWFIGQLDWWNKTDKVLSPMDVIEDILDGSRGTYDGVNYRLIKGKLDKDWNHFWQLKDEAERETLAFLDENKFTREQEEKIGFMAAREQEGGIEKLKNLGFTDEEINKVELSEKEREYLERVKKDFEEQYPFVKQLAKELYNVDVGKVKNYVSFMTDWSAMDEVEVVQRFGPNAEEFGAPTKQVERGFLKTRVGRGEQKIKLNITNIYLKHMNNVMYFRTMARDTQMLFEIVNSEEYRNAAGDLGQLLNLEWLDLMARQGGHAGAGQITSIDTIRKNVSAGILGLKLTSVAIQWTAVLDGVGMIGPTWTAKGSIDFATSKEWREFAMRFPELKERMGGELAIRELVNGNVLQKIQLKGFIPLRMIDQFAATSIAIGAYQQNMQSRGKQIDLTGAPDPEAMEYAQLVVRRTQSSGQFKDLPLALSRGEGITNNRSLNRALFQFQTFLLTRWSRIRHDAIRVGITQRDPKQVANVLLWIIIASLAATGTRLGVKRLLDFITGKEEEDDVDKQLLQGMMYEIMGTIPFLGNIWGAYVYDSTLLPLMEVPQNVIQGGKRAITSKSIEAKTKGVIQFLSSVGALLGIPGAFQAEQILRGVVPEPSKGGVFKATDFLQRTGGGMKATDFLRK